VRIDFVTKTTRHQMNRDADTPPEAALARALAEVERLRADNARLTELLDMAQEFGRLGVWERNARTLEGRWDAHVFRFFGFDAASGRTPPFAEAARRIHPDDRLNEAFLASLKRPGAHAHRYRVMLPGGAVRHLHSQWRVIPGPDGQTERVVGVMMDDTESRELAREAATAAAQLELALSLSGIGLWRYDFATARVHYDTRGQDMLARPMAPEGVPQSTEREWIHPEDRPDVQAAFDKALATDGPVDTQARYLHGDGTWRTILWRRVVQRDAQGQPTVMIGVGLDVTEQQRRTMEALKLAQRLDEAAEAARIGLWSGPMDGSLPQWNPLMFTLLGHDPAEGPLRMGELLRRYTHPDDRDRVAEQALSWVRGSPEQPLTSEMRIVRGDGTMRWIEVRCRQQNGGDGVRRAYGVLLDVTEQREALERLREANERLTLALSSVSMGTWSRDLRTNEDLWDEQMFRLRGLEPRTRALNDAERLAMVLPEDRALVQGVLEPFVHTGQPLEYEFRLQRADGQIRTIASRSIALTDDSGRAYRRIGVNWDVTDARLAERTQREREVALRESRAKSALLSRVSHELRTPLNAVLGFTQLMLAQGSGGDALQRRRWLQQIQAAGQGLLALIDGVLDLNEQADETGPAATTQLQLAPVIDRVLSQHAADIGARRLVVQREDGAHGVVADERRLQQVLAQLIGNAVKFNRAGGMLTVSAHVEGDETVVSIGDQGAGVAPSRVPRLFEAFGGAATGPGIGLAIAQAMAQRMGGRIELAHTGSDGSVFELRLPSSNRSSAASGAGAAAQARPLVLYIEDNDVNMMIVRELLTQRPDIAFQGAPDGRSGLAMVRELKPALLLVDMQLPDIDGIEVLRRLRSDPATAGVTCVALSANAMPEDVQQARAAGFDDYWTKPIDLGEFLKALDRLVPEAPPAPRG